MALLSVNEFCALPVLMIAPAREARLSATVELRSVSAAAEAIAAAEVQDSPARGVQQVSGAGGLRLVGVDQAVLDRHRAEEVRDARPGGRATAGDVHVVERRRGVGGEDVAAEAAVRVAAADGQVRDHRTPRRSPTLASRAPPRSSCCVRPRPGGAPGVLSSARCRRACTSRLRGRSGRHRRAARQPRAPRGCSCTRSPAQLPGMSAVPVTVKSAARGSGRQRQQRRRPSRE